MKSRTVCLTLLLAALFLAPAAALAVDGTKLIDQARALAGNVTPGDAAGFPVTLSQPGSYRLSGNLTVPSADATAIEITADEVSLDLNGFAILGPTVCSGSPLACVPEGSGKGIFTDQQGVSVSNGKIRGMGAAGVDLGNAAAVTDLEVRSNGGDGITASIGVKVSGNVVRQNGRGVAVGSGTVSGNTVSSNGTDGIVVNIGAVTGNTVDHNGSIGIYCGSGLVSGNSVRFNALGLDLGSTAGYLGNALAENDDDVDGGVNLGQNLCDTGLCP